ncbi:MAG: hypothetical protein ACLUJG_10785 [Lawsonibacter sp.]
MPETCWWTRPPRSCDLHSQYLNKVVDINRHYMGVLRVGISYTCGLAVLPEILPQFRREFPMV